MNKPMRAATLALMIHLAAAPVHAADANAEAKANAAAQFDVATTGKGKPVILIPGLVSPGAVWDSTVDHLCKRGPYQCHVLSLAGFAGKPAVAAPSLDTVKQQLASYIRAKGLGQATLIGHSLGGLLALRLAIDEPKLVGRVVVVDSLPALGAAQMASLTSAQLRDMAAQQRKAMLAQPAAQMDAGTAMAIRTMATSPAHVETITGWSRQSDRATVVHAMTDLMGTDLRQDVARITAPVLVLGTWIAYRDFAPRSAIEATFRDQYKQAPTAKIEMSDTARHFVMLDDPAWMLDRIDRFLAQ